MLQQLLNHFQTLDQRPVERMAILVCGLLLFWMIEGAIPLFNLQYKKTKTRHAAVNLAFTGMHLIIHTFLAVIIILLSDWTKNNQFGLVHWFNTSVGATIIISIFVLDFFGGWLVHFTEHKFYALWKFHVVHHADNNVDVTTGLRHHPVESVLRGLFFFAGILVCGAPMYAVMIFQTVLILFVAFTHANIRLPHKVDSTLSLIFISPNMHKVHHHYMQPFTDSNYGAIFSIWDRLLGTFMKMDPATIKYGLDRYYPNSADENFIQLLTRPFKPMKEK